MVKALVLFLSMIKAYPAETLLAVLIGAFYSVVHYSKISQDPGVTTRALGRPLEYRKMVVQRNIVGINFNWVLSEVMQVSESKP
jgi:hypothetical protein